MMCYKLAILLCVLGSLHGRLSLEEVGALIDLSIDMANVLERNAVTFYGFEDEQSMVHFIERLSSSKMNIYTTSKSNQN